MATARNNRTRWEQAEARILTRALTLHRWNVSRTANYLGISRSRVYALIDRHGIERKRAELVGFWKAVRQLEVEVKARPIKSLTQEECEELYGACRTAYRIKARLTHPDYGGYANDFVEVRKAWDTVRLAIGGKV